MKNIKVFNSIEDFNEYLNNNSKFILNNFGCSNIHMTKDNEILKDMSNFNYPLKLLNENDIIMDGDYDLESFIFPNELYIFEDNILGYKSKYFNNDIMEDNLRYINIEALLKARKRIIKDIKVLSNEGYYLWGLALNTLFDNEKLCAISTVNYCKALSVKLKHNIDMLDTGLIMRLKDHNMISENADDYDLHKAISKVIKK